MLKDIITSLPPENCFKTGVIATRLIKKPAARPIPPPTMLMAADSVRNCERIAPVVAPIALRIPISCRRHGNQHNIHNPDAAD